MEACPYILHVILSRSQDPELHRALHFDATSNVSTIIFSLKNDTASMI